MYRRGRRLEAEQYRKTTSVILPTEHQQDEESHSGEMMRCYSKATAESSPEHLLDITPRSGAAVPPSHGQARQAGRS